MLRHLVQLADAADLHDSQGWPDDTRRQEHIAWIFVAVLGFISIIAFYLSWLR
jgi:hypothetical protein